MGDLPRISKEARAVIVSKVTGLRVCRERALADAIEFLLEFHDSAPARIAAAVAAERERCAKVCEGCAKTLAEMVFDSAEPDHARRRESMEATATRLAAAIRAGGDNAR